MENSAFESTKIVTSGSSRQISHNIATKHPKHTILLHFLIEFALLVHIVEGVLEAGAALVFDAYSQEPRRLGV